MRFVQWRPLVVLILAFGMFAHKLQAELATGWVGDIPVPVSALIETDSGIEFDSPSGRVIQFTFQIAADEAAITAFYQNALPPLGWQLSADGFVRGKEMVMVTASPQKAIAGRSLYEVTIAPVDSVAFQQ